MVAANYYEYDGFVIIMGTDTMAYTASCLSFMFENLAKPVVFTGSMIPLFKGESDARRNLLLSVKIAATSNVPEVCIFFHDRLLRGSRAKKMSATALDAFDSPNLPPLATWGTSLVINEALVLKHPRKPFELKKKLDARILVIRMIPGFSDVALRGLLAPVLQDDNKKQEKLINGLVLELYGVGNIPIRKKGMLELLEKLIGRGVVVAVCSQCIKGKVNLLAYEVGKRLHNMGAMSTYDMTVEAVSTKLAYLFGQYPTKPERVKYLLTKSLRGELTEPFYV